MANAIARKLRKSMTPQEVKLWVKLRELRAVGHHFRRQSPILNYIVDFECRRSRIIVEVDGTQHGFDANRERDLARGEHLGRAGYNVLRFANSEIDRELDAVMQVIFFRSRIVSPHPVPRCARNHLRCGEGMNPTPLSAARLAPPLPGRDKPHPVPRCARNHPPLAGRDKPHPAQRCALRHPPLRGGIMPLSGRNHAALVLRSPLRRLSRYRLTACIRASTLPSKKWFAPGTIF